MKRGALPGGAIQVTVKQGLQGMTLWAPWAYNLLANYRLVSGHC